MIKSLKNNSNPLIQFIIGFTEGMLKKNKMDEITNASTDYVKGIYLAIEFQDNRTLNKKILKSTKIRNPFTPLFEIFNIINYINDLPLQISIEVEPFLYSKINNMIKEILDLSLEGMTSSHIMSCIVWAIMELTIFPHLNFSDLNDSKYTRREFQRFLKSKIEVERTAGILALAPSAGDSILHSFFEDPDHNIRRGIAVILPLLSHPHHQIIDSERYRDTKYGEILMGVHFSAYFKSKFFEKTNPKLGQELKIASSKKALEDFLHSHPETRLAASIIYTALLNSTEEFIIRLKELITNKNWNLRMGAAYGTIFILLEKKIEKAKLKVKSLLEQLLQDEVPEVVTASALAVTLYALIIDDDKTYNIFIKMSSSNLLILRACALLGLCSLYLFKQGDSSFLENLKPMIRSLPNLDEKILFYLIPIIIIDLFYQWMDLGALIFFFILAMSKYYVNYKGDFND